MDLNLPALLELVYEDNILRIVRNPDGSFTSYVIRDSSRWAYFDDFSDIGHVTSDPVKKAVFNNFADFVVNVTHLAQSNGGVLDFTAYLSLLGGKQLHIYDIENEGQTTPNIIIGNNTEFFARDWSGEITAKDTAQIYNSYSSDQILDPHSPQNSVINLKPGTIVIENLYGSSDTYNITIPAKQNGVSKFGDFTISDFGRSDKLTIIASQNINLSKDSFKYEHDKSNVADLVITAKDGSGISGTITIKNYYIDRIGRDDQIENITFKSSAGQVSYNLADVALANYQNYRIYAGPNKDGKITSAPELPVGPDTGLYPTSVANPTIGDKFTEFEAMSRYFNRTLGDGTHDGQAVLTSLDDLDRAVTDKFVGTNILNNSRIMTTLQHVEENAKSMGGHAIAYIDLPLTEIRVDFFNGALGYQYGKIVPALFDFTAALDISKYTSLLLGADLAQMSSAFSFSELGRIASIYGQLPFKLEDLAIAVDLTISPTHLLPTFTITGQLSFDVHERGDDGLVKIDTYNFDVNDRGGPGAIVVEQIHSRGKGTDYNIYAPENESRDFSFTGYLDWQKILDYYLPQEKDPPHDIWPFPPFPPKPEDVPPASPPPTARETVKAILIQQGVKAILTPRTDEAAKRVFGKIVTDHASEHALANTFNIDRINQQIHQPGVYDPTGHFMQPIDDSGAGYVPSQEPLEYGDTGNNPLDVPSGQPIQPEDIPRLTAPKKKKKSKQVSWWKKILAVIPFVPVGITDSGIVTLGRFVATALLGPLAVDLDGDGLELISYENSKAFFDAKGNGFVNATAWVSKDDGLLSVDWNADGKINDINELFGYVASDGFSDLRHYDDNGDNRIDNQDAIFSLLKIWQDLNEDGITDPGELKSISELNISAISLVTKSENMVIAGNTVTSSAQIILSDNSTLKIYDANFEFSHTITKYIGDYQLDADLTALPWVRGYGIVKDLLIEASLDSTLKLFLQNLNSESNPLVIYNKMDELIARWGDVDNSAINSFSGITTTQKRKLLQNLFDWDDADPALNQADSVIDAAFLDFKNKIFVDYIVQTPAGSKLGIGYDFFNDRYILEADFYTRLVQGFTDTKNNFSSYLIANVLNLGGLLDVGQLLLEISNKGIAIQIYDYLVRSIQLIVPNIDGSVTGDSADNILYSTNTNLAGVILQGGDGNDVLVSTVGSDTLQGGNGNDVYILDLQSGNDTIVDAAGTDQLVLGAGISKDTLILAQSGNDLILSVDTTIFATIQNFYTTGTIEKISFIDGTFLTGSNILAMTATINGTAGADTLVGNNFVNTISGSGGNDTITGGAGNDTLDGGTGTDSLSGGTGNDVYTVDDAGDVVTENASEGTDTVNASVSYTLSANVENLTLTGSGNISATGNELNNILIGNSGANTLSGGLGDDTYVIDNLDTVVENADSGIDTVQIATSYALGTNLENLTLTGASAITGTGNNLDNVLTGNNAASTLIGGLGNDTYVISNSAAVITENASEGTDMVQTSVNYTLASNLENLTLTGTSTLSGTGNSLDNTLTGNAAASTLIGGAGNDMYLVSDAGTVIMENASEGTDTVQTSVSYTLSANMENLTLTALDAINATGNSLNNMLTGNSNNNVLDGSSGADTLVGGLGNDTYSVDNVGDVVTENASEGMDTVQSSINYTLGANLENLMLTSGSALSGTGNSGDNVLTGNNAASTLLGGLGNDTYVISNNTTVITENSGEGTDTVQTSVSYTLSANVENLTLTGGSALSGTGNSLDNILTGNNAASTLIGGLGNDTYIVANSTTVITENASEGTDSVQASVDYTLGIQVENLMLTGTSNLNGTGNSLNNILFGNSGNNTLDGSTGADTLAGGLGNDLYIVDNAGDVIQETASEGVDSVQSSVTYTLANYVENLTLTGASSINATGTNYHNQLTGNSAANLLRGLDGDDTLDGGTGADTLVGGQGNDLFIVDNTGDVVTEAISEGADTVQTSLSYTLGANVENLTLTGGSTLTATGNSLDNVITGNNAASTLIGGLGNDTYIVANSSTVITENASEGTDTVQTGFSYTLSSNLENLALTGTSALTGVGNSANNVLTANDAASTLIGNAGNDTYVISNAATMITENASEGSDSVQSSVNYTLGSNLENLTLTGSGDINATGNSTNNVLIGNDGDNILDGSTGSDTLIGGDGSDTYVIDSIGDLIQEKAGEGVDTVQSAVAFSLDPYLENLTLTGASAINGTGNAYNNILIGNTAANLLTGLDGNDTLDGGTGADTLIGGIGNDIYTVDNAGDVITENASEGTDSVNASISYTLSNNLEYLFLTGSSNINGTGNTLNNWLVGNSGTNLLTALAGDDTLDGGTGVDTLVGGTGNDLYLVDNSSDVITENSGEGVDTVQSSATYTLASNIENLILTGLNVIDGTGNTLDNELSGNSRNNTLTGNAGNDILDGGIGADTLVGGTGNDTYIVDNSGDVITENSAEGSDLVKASVSYTLSANIEDLMLMGTNSINGTGNSSNNRITGNSGDNILDGGAGADVLIGGAGDDTYLVDNAGDLTGEFVDEGYDTVLASVTYTLGANVEDLTLMTGSGAINGTGNTLDNWLTGNESANQLSGGAGNDTLDGSAGADTLIGGTGDDTYVVESASDVITESASEGTDMVESSISWTLGSNLENLMLIGTAALNAVGNSLNNTLIGNEGNSTLAGGTGNDIYVIQNATMVITENAAEGTDTVQSSVSYTLGANLENLTLTGYNSTAGTGNSGANVMTGNSSDNTLDGGLGADSLIGGLGDDVYIVDNSGDVVTENASEGIDTIQASLSYTLSANTENLTLTGGSALTATGNSLDNILTGNNAASTLIGGMGNDLYIISNSATVITENASEGTDTVQSSVSYTLSTNVENLTLTGSSALNGTGNSLNNVLTGNNAASTLIGGAGNDTYIISNAATVVTEGAAAGTDTVQSSVTYTLSANVENLTLTGSNALSGTGNSLDNTLSDGTGLSTLSGGAGNDTYVTSSAQSVVQENAAEGTDTVQASVSYTLSANVENLTLTGTSDLNATGNTANNTLTGNSGNNILDGGTGADTLSGGTGNDTYVVDNAGDVVSESASAGTDTVQSSVSYTLGSNVENLTLTGSSALTATGNSADNVLSGNSGNSTLIGGLGNDTYAIQNATTVITENASEGTDTVQSSVSYTLGTNLENLTLTGSSALTATGNSGANVITGNNGASTLLGGAGNDTYVVSGIDTVVTENVSEGTDTVQASVSYTLGSNLENLTLTSTGNINGTGNTGNNQLTGNTGNNVLVGGDGNDTLDGGIGEDTLVGGLGNDTYVLDNLSDVVQENAAEGTDTIQTSVTYSLGANIENLTLTGTSDLSATGNTANNTLTGNSGNNQIDGGTGADTLIGGTGNDTYTVDNAGDVVTENASEGTDTVLTSINYTLGSNVENITLTGLSNLTATGNSGNNVLTGNEGNSTLVGGAGDDTYILQNLGTVITENAASGTDTVQVLFNYTLGSNLENLTLTGSNNLSGTGNSLNNVITGNSGNNTLDGSTGSDTLIGGMGNDTYMVDNAGDVVTENASEGVDLVLASASYTLSNYVENLTLTGSSNLSGTGNAAHNLITGNTGNNNLSGGAGNDTLDGGTGADTMAGGTGDDTYVVDNVGDVLTENPSEGTDTVQSSITYTLANYFENLTLTGTAHISGTGNAWGNVITGNAGNNILSGLDGNDTIDGGTGSDAMTGGTGDDVYYVDHSGDTVTENANEGTDTVNASIDYVLGTNIEKLTLISTGNISGTGNAIDNLVIGNTGDNRIDGGAGNDTMAGGVGNDTYVVDSSQDVVLENANEGADSVESSADWTLSANVENLTLTGITAILGAGNALDNKITGNAQDNSLSGGLGSDSLDGGLGMDTLVGGVGNDVYTVDNSSDVVVENASEGIDTVYANTSYVLSENIENIILYGDTATTVIGNASDNVLTGNLISNALDGGAGNDTYRILSGPMGSDTITDASGSDTLDFSQFGTAINLNLANTSFSLSNTGRALPLLTGADGSPTVSDQFGATWTAYGNMAIQSATPWKTGEKYLTLDGNGDYLRTSSVGLTGDQMTLRFKFKLNATGSNQTLVYGASTYSLQLYYMSSNNLQMSISSNGSSFNVTNNNNGVKTNWAANTWYDVELTYSSTGGYKVYVDGVLDMSTTNTGKIYNGSGGFTIGASNTGNNGFNGAISDIYLTNTDLLHTANFTPSTQSAINLYGDTNEIIWAANAMENAIGTTGNDTLSGSSGDNILTGGQGNDSLDGGAGNDAYKFASGFGTDTISDASGSDTLDFSAFSNAVTVSLGNTSFTESAGNTVSWSSGAMENLVGGTGNDALTGNSSDNRLTGGTGNDTLTGGTGNDTLDGGDGNDTYSFASGFGTDSITDAAGSDTLDFSAFTSAVSVSLASTSFTASAGNTVSWDAGAMENLIGGTGNDTLTGSTGDNTLTGGTGNDALDGSSGNDTYKFASGFGTDTITDASGADTLDFSAFNTGVTVSLGSTSFTASAGNTVSWSSGAMENLIGGSGNDSLTGNASDNILTGGSGSDTLDGGAGNDIYRFTGNGEASITDSAGVDTLDFSKATNGMTVDLTKTEATDLSNQSDTTRSLLRFSGTDGSTAITDYFANTWSLYGNASVQSSSPWKSGEKHIALDGSGDYIRTTGIGLSGDQMTLRFKFKLGALGSQVSLVYGSTTYSLQLLFLASNKLQMSISSNGSSFDVTNNNNGTKTSWSANTWYDLEFTYSNTAGYKVYVDGVLDMSSASTGKIYNGSGGLTIGASNTGSSGVNGAIADVYLTNTEVLHTSNFTPPATSYLPNGATRATWASNAMENATTGSGNDTLVGTSSANVLSGGIGNDILSGGAGNDSLDGGAGNDTYQFASGFGADTITDSDGADTLDLSALTSNLTVDLSSTGMTESAGNTIAWTANTLENITGGTGNDSLTGTSANNLLIGGTGNDTLAAGQGQDTLNGGDGDDTYVFSSDFGLDSIIDSAGTDTFDFSSIVTAMNIDLSNATHSTDAFGNTLVWPTGQIENVKTGSAGDTILGNSASNVLDGGSGNDTLDGSTGQDTLLGGDGDDLLIASAGNDQLNGGQGNDRYQINSGFGADTITDASGSDTLDFSSFTKNLTLDLTQTRYQDGTLSADGLHSLLHFGGADSSTTMTDEYGHTWSAFGNASIQSSSPWLTGEKHVALDGSGDYIRTTAVGLTGNEMTLRFKFKLNATGTNQTLVYGASTYSLQLYYLSGRLQMSISSNGSSFDVTNNNNGIKTSWATNTWYDLEFTYSNTAGYKVYVDGVLDMSTASTGKIYNGSGGLTVGASNSGSSGLNGAVADLFLSNTEVLHTTNFVPSTIPYNVLDSVSWSSNTMENLTGGSGNDTLNGNTQANSLTGGAGNDTLSASSGEDSLFGGVGNDSLDGGSGNDALSGEDGTDTLVGGSGNDSLEGGAGEDTYKFASGFGTDTVNDASGSDTLDFSAFSSALSISLASTSFTESAGNTVGWGAGTIENLITGSGNDSLTGSTGDNILTGGTGNDALDGGSGNDTYKFASGFGTDTITDSAGTDTLDFSGFSSGVTVSLGSTSFTASAGNTVSWSSGAMENLIGGSGNDSLTGSTSDNSLTGGAGNDSLDGGSGNDTYKFGASYGSDVITDSAGTDTLDFSSVSGGMSIDLTKTDATYVPSQTDITRSLLRFGGTDGSTTVADAFGNAWSLFGNASVQSSSPWKSGEKHIALDGSGDYIRTTGIGLSGDQMTLRFKFKLGALGSQVSLVYGSTTYSLQLLFLASNKLQMSISSNGSSFDVTNNNNGTKTSWSANTWYDLEFTYSNTGGYKVYVDGVLDMSSASTGKIYNGSGGLTIGATNTGSSGVNGAIADVYLTNTEVLHTSNFTAPTDPYLPADGTRATWSSNALENAISGAGNDTLTGSSAANALTGGAGSDTLSGGTGNDTLNGGAGNDTYAFNIGDGQDLVIDSDPTAGNVDKVQLGSGITVSSVALYMSNGDLQIGYSSNATDVITIQAQLADTPAIERIELGNGYYMTDADINQIVADMAAYATSHSISMTNLDDVKNNTDLMNIVAAGWHN